VIYLHVSTLTAAETCKYWLMPKIVLHIKRPLLRCFVQLNAPCIFTKLRLTIKYTRRSFSICTLY